jgi:hypothetical protein
MQELEELRVNAESIEEAQTWTATAPPREALRLEPCASASNQMNCRLSNWQQERRVKPCPNSFVASCLPEQEREPVDIKFGHYQQTPSIDEIVCIQ